MYISMWIMIMSFNLMAIMNKNMMSMWFFMEMGNLIFLYSLIKMKNPSKTPFIYFLVSVISSIFIIYEISILNQEQSIMTTNLNSNTNYLSTLAFIMKMGVIPFHSWIFKMAENMEWVSLNVLMTIKKIIPIWYMSMFSSTKMLVFMLWINLISFIFIPLKSNNSFYMISSSSIANSMWIILCSISSSISSILFSLSYFLVNSNLILTLKKNNSKIKSEENSTEISILMLTLMGFPPLPMFFMKIMVIKNTIFLQDSMVYISLMMMVSNLLSSIMYMKFMLNPMISFKKSSNWKKMFNMMKTTILSSQLSYLIYFISISIK